MTEQATLFQWRSGQPSPPRGALSGASVAQRAGVIRGELRTFHGRLERRIGTVDLVVTDNRRRMVTARRRSGRVELRVHHMFVGCDDATLAALVGLTAGERSSRDVIRAYIGENRDRIAAAPCLEELDTDGRHHDLLEIARRVRGYLDCAELADVRITWGRDGRGRRSIRFGSFDFDRRLVRVHPALDAGWVPAFFVEFVVYHEMLHAVVPPTRADGSSRRQLHPPRFRELERQFPRYDEAMAWEKKNLGRFLRRGDT